MRDLFTAAEVLVNTTFAYNPLTQGPITSFSASVDKDLFTSVESTQFGNTFRPTIEQGGVFYVAAIPGPTITTGPGGGSTGYNTISSNLTAADFLSYDVTTDTFRTANPNFTGGPMLFGLTQIFGVNITEVTQAEFDNLSFTIGTPEPTSIALLGGVGLLGLGYLKRRS